MRNLLLIAVSTMLWVGCKKDPVKELPEASARGANIFACIIDGEVYNVKHNEEVTHKCSNKCYLKSKGLGSVQIYADNCNAKNTFETISLYIYDTLEMNKTYTSTENQIKFVTSRLHGLTSGYQTIPDLNFKLTISLYNDSIISGTFTGQAIGYRGLDSGKVINIENGRFDLKIY